MKIEKTFPTFAESRAEFIVNPNLVGEIQAVCDRYDSKVAELERKSDAIISKQGIKDDTVANQVQILILERNALEIEVKKLKAEFEAKISELKKVEAYFTELLIKKED